MAKVVESIETKESVMQRYIMHFAATNFFGGPENQIVNHCALLNSARWKVIVCSFLEGKPQNELLDLAASLNLKTATLYTVSAYNPVVLKELALLLRKEKPDLIVVHGYRPLILCLILKPFFRFTIIVYSRGFTAESLKIRIYEKIYRLSMRLSNSILAVSDGHKRVLREYGVPENKIKVVHNAVSIDSFESLKKINMRKEVLERLGIPSEGKLIVSAGRLSPEKGHRFLVEAIGMLRGSMNNNHFVFCGDGPCQKDLEKQSKELGISEICHFVGFRRDLKEIFQAMDLMVLPSLTEGLPNVVLEAFACAKPVVATAVGGVPEIVENGVNGILVPKERPDLLAEAIKGCLADPGKSRMMGEAGYNKVKTEFTFESQTQKLEAIYNQLAVPLQE